MRGGVDTFFICNMPRRCGRVVKILKPTVDHQCFLLEQESLLQLLHSTQVKMGTWPFGSIVCPNNDVNRLTGRCGIPCGMCLSLLYPG